LNNLPSGQATLRDLELAQQSSQDAKLDDKERALWALIAALIRRHRRTDLMIDDSALKMIQTGEFDIEIEV
jgi:hypothetical protein